MEYSNNTIETLFQKFRSILGADHDKYRNHAYRVFLYCLLIDNEESNKEKYAIAAVFHDIGIWTDHTLDYLNPSIEQAKIYLIKTGRQHWIEEITAMIYWHHKIKKYKSEYGKTTETFRKADWIDVSFGLRAFGVDGKKIKEIKKNLPNLRFHRFLLKRILKNFFKHPLRPLPMFKN
jgi:HD superfamily phosphodiesterase